MHLFHSIYLLFRGSCLIIIIIIIIIIIMSRDSVVERSEFEFQQGRNFLFSTSSRASIQWLIGTLLPGVKAAGT
jgi:hypothetical protein